MSSRLMPWVNRWSLALCLALPLTAAAKDAAPASDDPVLEARVMRISAELRCWSARTRPLPTRMPTSRRTCAARCARC